MHKFHVHSRVPAETVTAPTSNSCQLLWTEASRLKQCYEWLHVSTCKVVFFWCTGAVLPRCPFWRHQ